MREREREKKCMDRLISGESGVFIFNYYSIILIAAREKSNSVMGRRSNNFL